MQELTAWIRSHPELAAVSMLIGWLAILALFVLGKTLWERRRDSRKAVRWVNAHLIQLLSWLALPALVVALVRSYLDPASKPYHQLVLAGLVLATAVLAQFGSDLLPRLKKVGPVEFVEQTFERMLPELKGLPVFDLVGTTKQVYSEKLLYEYERADRYVSYLEWSGLPIGIARNETFYDLLLEMSAVALYKRDWLRAADRLELLLKISGGKFKAAEAHYRCGLAHSYWAQRSQSEDAYDAFKQSHDHFWKALQEDPHNWLAYFNLAYVQVDLGMFELARQNNEKALEIYPSYGPAKYNLAICYIKLGNLDAALEALRRLKAGDEDAKTLAEMAPDDPELTPLLDDVNRGPVAKGLLRSLKSKP